MFKALAKPGLVILLCLSVSGVAFAQDEENFVQVAQVSKTKAVALSAVFPGLGQMTAGAKVKGVSMFVAEMLSLATLVNADEEYSTTLTEFNEGKVDLASYASGKQGNTYNAALEKFNDLKSKNNKLDDLNSTRNVALMVAAGVYAYSLFDAVFLSSYSTDGRKVEKLGDVTVASVMLQKTPGILISKRF